MKTYLVNKGVKSYISFMLVYLVIAVITITTRVLEIDEIQNMFKPMLMPILMIFVFVNSRFRTVYSRYILFALFFSMLGDIFLMPYFDIFIFGLASFLIAHVFYIFAFLRNNKLIEGIRKGKLSMTALIIAFLVLIFVLVQSMLASNTDFVLIIAVVVYASVITFMVLTSISSFYNHKTFEKKLILIGAILFMLSDSIIAINKFVLPIPLSGLWIMSTYTLAQWLIIVGSVARINSKLSK